MAKLCGHGTLPTATRSAENQLSSAHPDDRRQPVELQVSVNRQLTVLCGQTHSGRQTKKLPNLLAIIGGAEHGWPAVERASEIE